MKNWSTDRILKNLNILHLGRGKNATTPSDSETEKAKNFGTKK